MKKLLTIASLLCFFFNFAQHNVGKKIQELENERTYFNPFSILSASQEQPKTEIQDVVNDATLATIDKASINTIVANQYETIELEIPYQNQMVSVRLYKADIFAEGFHLDTDKQKNVPYQKGVYYRGIVKGDYTSVASFSFFPNEFNGIISNSTLSNLVVAKLDKPDNTDDYIVYSDANLKIANDFKCSVNDDEIKPRLNPNPTKRNGNTIKCVSMYLEVDYNLYQNNASNLTTTTNWMTSVFNNVKTLYLNDGINIAIKSIYVWTTPDSYAGTSSSDYLYQFNTVRPVFDGDVGQLVGKDPGGLGGVAVTINGLCTQDNFSYSDVDFAYSTVPTYSWTVQVITHEFGHLLGSPHTHACVWNGNNTAIDNCAPAALGSTWEGGSCMTTPPTIPSSSTKGTIMSYCHLISGVGISFNNGFGPQPSTAIINAVEAGTCLSTDCINTCINTISSVNVVSVTNNSAVLTWTETGSFTSWKVSVHTFGSNPFIWNTASTNTYTATGLLPNTYYVFEVKPNCASGLTGPTKKLIFSTGANYCSGITISDTGGVSGDYTNMENLVRTIIPDVASQKVTLTFSAFELELDYDYLYVYNGNTTSATSFNTAGYTGTTVPGPFVSSATDGSLTIRFYSDQGVVASGWIATTSCSPNLSSDQFSGIDFTYYPNPTNGQVAISSKTEMNHVKVYNVAGQLLYEKDVNDMNTNVDISSYATGTYFFKLKFGDKEVNFKVLKM